MGRSYRFVFQLCSKIFNNYEHVKASPGLGDLGTYICAIVIL
jgi:hypothetical protein